MTNPHHRANRILEALRACRTEGEMQAISRRSEGAIAHLQKEAPVRVIHIVNLAKMKRQDLARKQRDLFK